MRFYFIKKRDDARYQLLRKLISDYPQLKKGFEFGEIIKLSPLSRNDRKILKEMFGGSYSEIFTPDIHLEYRNNKWEVDEIDVELVLHRRALLLLNHSLNHGRYSLNSPVSTKDTELVEFLIREDNWLGQKLYEKWKRESREPDFSGPEDPEEDTPVTQESLEFLSNGLQEKLGEVSCFDYELVKAFLESVEDFLDISLERFFEQYGGTFLARP